MKEGSPIPIPDNNELPGHTDSSKQFLFEGSDGYHYSPPPKYDASTRDPGLAKFQTAMAHAILYWIRHSDDIEKTFGKPSEIQTESDRIG